MADNITKLFFPIVWLFFCNSIQAQIISDDTLPENSIVNPNCTICLIEGGTTKNNNLFHSFKQFSVPTNGEAIFNNATQIQNIFTRVTGNSISEINGIIRAQGSANLFLINPNGIIFGANAQLDIGGSFLATTADSILFDDNSVLSARTPQRPSLLTVSVPMGLQFGENPGEIVNKSQAKESLVLPNLPPKEVLVGLKVEDGKTIALVGSEITLNSGLVNAFGGRIELGSVAANSFIDLFQNAEGFVLGYDSVNQFNHISIIDNSRLSTRTSRNLPSGNIHIYGNLVEFNKSNILSFNGSDLDGGEIIIDAETLILLDTRVSTRTFEEGKAGDITVNADSIKLIKEQSNRDSGLFSQTDIDSSGDSGNITIHTNDLTLENGAEIGVSTFGSGVGGNLTVNASESIEVIGRTLDGEFPSGLFAESEGGRATGDGGNLNINTGSLIVRDGARISVGAIEDFNDFRLGTSQGSGGTLEINATESIEVRGFGFDEDGKIVPSTLLSESQGIGDAGDISLNTPKLTVTNLGEVNVSATGGGKAGSLKINTGISKPKIDITLDNGRLTAETQKGNQGNIEIDKASSILLRNNSQITTNASDEATGGNITINSDVVGLFNNSDITANAIEGRGGNINITTQGLFQDFSSTIDASSEENIDGTITINDPDVDPTSGIIELPSVPVDAETIFAQDLCKFEDQKIAGGSSFIITGRGGLTPTAEDSLDNVNNVVGWAHRDDITVSHNGTVGVRQRSQKETPATNYAVIQQSQGWVTTADGSVWLVANPPETILQKSKIAHPDCGNSL